MTIHKKMFEIQSELKAPKNQKNTFGNYNYRSCEDILESVKPLAHEKECYVTVIDEMVMLGDRFYVKATASLTDGKDTVSTTAYAREPLNKKGMDEAQVTGATSSYARKYALNGLFCIDDTKDADTDENKKQSNAMAEKKTKEDEEQRERDLKHCIKMLDNCKSLDDLERAKKDTITRTMNHFKKDGDTKRYKELATHGIKTKEAIEKLNQTPEEAQNEQ